MENYNRYDLPKWRTLLGVRVSIGKLGRFSALLRSKVSN